MCTDKRGGAVSEYLRGFASALRTRSRLRADNIATYVQGRKHSLAAARALIGVCVSPLVRCC